MRTPGGRGLLLVALALCLGACGKRGAPVAPERRLPAAVQDLTAAMIGEGVRLTWSLPRIRVDRSAVKDLRRTEVYRRLEAEGAPEPPRPAVLTFEGLFGAPPGVAGFERVASIALTEPGAAAPRSNQIVHTDAQSLAFGRRYTYVVVTIDEQGRPSPPSNRVGLLVAAAPRPPSGVAADPGDRQVLLTWQAPTSLEDGSPTAAPLLYNVFRASSPDTRPARPLNPEPIAATRYVDLAVQNDATYHYSVRALLGAGGPASHASDTIPATPEDTTAPAQPRGLVAVAAGATVRLAWEAVTDPDLAGYHVYRSATPARGFTRVTAALQAPTTFVDTQVRAGQTYYYVVTAIDRSRRANESVPSAEVAASVP